MSLTIFYSWWMSTFLSLLALTASLKNGNNENAIIAFIVFFLLFRIDFEK